MSRRRLGDHLGVIGQQVAVTGTVRTATRVNGFTPRSADRALIVVDAGAAMVKIVTTAAWAYDVERGEMVTLGGHGEGPQRVAGHQANRPDPGGPDRPGARRPGRVHRGRPVGSRESR